MNKRSHESDIQRNYYATTAKNYDSMHLHDNEEHVIALSFLTGVIDLLDIASILDVGSGTGRALLHLKERCPHVDLLGIEPVKELREQGYAKGLGENELIEGDAKAIPLGGCSFDLVCEFGVLHHVNNPSLVVSEMLRVAKKAILISDVNNFGQGSLGHRTLKQIANALGLWPLVDFVKTKGRRYTFSVGDGLAYSYSVYNDLRLIRDSCTSVHILNTKGACGDPYRNASHVAVLGIKESDV